MDDDVIGEIAENVVIAATRGDEEPLAMVDQALDAIVAALGVIEDNLPKIKAENVPQQAALDNLKETLETAAKPYVTDMLKDILVFGGE